VNGWWMCDHGRENYEWINRGDRIEAPLVRDGNGGSQAVDWKPALGALLGKAEGAGSVKAVASSSASNEDLGLLRALVEELGGGDTVYRSARADDEIVSGASQGPRGQHRGRGPHRAGACGQR
jgi:predicted molibdopterin-dependent oxidoreductase YjgC